MKKVAPSGQFREGLHGYLADLGDMGNGAEVLSELVRRAATLVVQEALEAEQRDFIGRDRYERSRCRTSGRRRWPTGPSCSLLL